jgi:hypothetical protein
VPSDAFVWKRTWMTEDFATESFVFSYTILDRHPQT